MKSSVDALNCPNCGAPLEFTQDQTLVRCKFCSSSVERSDATPTLDDAGHALRASFADGRITVEQSSNARRFVIKMRGGRPVVIEDSQIVPQVVTSVSYIATNSQVAQAKAGGCVAPFLIISFILLVTIVPIILAMGNPTQIANVLKLVFSGKIDEAITTTSTLGKNVRVSGSGVLAPFGADGPPDIIVLTNQFPLGEGETENRILALRSAEPVMLWQSESLGKSVYRAPIMAGPDFVYALHEDKLWALHRADGQTAWTATLADKVSFSVCPNCVRLLGIYLFTLSDDGTLQAYNAQTGAPAWKFQANQDSPRGLYVLGGRLAFIDQDENNHGLLRLFDPASGKMETVQPECRPDRNSRYASYASWTTPIYTSPDAASFYILFDECVQHWDAKTLKLVWSTTPADRFYGEVFPLATEEAFYLGVQGKLVVFEAVTGKLQTLLEDKDYEFVALAVEGDTLIVRAIRTRGSQRSELWALDKSSDKRRWMVDLGESPSLDPPHASAGSISEDKPVWTWHITSKGLAILRFKAAEDDVSHAILLETLDVKTGESSGQQEIRLGVDTIILSAPGFTLWQGDTLWMPIEGKLLGFDAAAGKITYRWP